MDDRNKESELNNSHLQADEIEALSAIFGDEWTLEVDNIYSMKISNRVGNEVYFQVTLPKSYPLDSPPIYQISAPWMSRIIKNKLCSELEDVYRKNIGESIIYLWIEKIKDFIEEESCLLTGNNEMSPTHDINIDVAIALCTVENDASLIKEREIYEIPKIEHGEPIVDRKSVFQAHVAKVVSENQVKQVLEKLKENRKIASATHNIYAYRICSQNKNSFIQDCDDDGETKAGSILLHLLQILNVSDMLVVVSRWYGGIHLGSDRFKHINNAARNLFSQLGMIKDEKASRSTKNGKK